MIHAVRAAIAPELTSPGFADGSTNDRPKYGIRIKSEGDDDTWLVGRVDHNSPAGVGGLREGDRIIAINGTPLTNIGESDRLAAFAKSPLTIQVERDGKRMDITLQLP
jgi:S1-C subfamily serine protease